MEGTNRPSAKKKMILRSKNAASGAVAATQIERTTKLIQVAISVPMIMSQYSRPRRAHTNVEEKRMVAATTSRTGVKAGTQGGHRVSSGNRPIS